MVEVTYTGKEPRLFAGRVWIKNEKRDVTNARHLDYHERHPDFKVAKGGGKKSSSKKDS